MDTSIYRAVHNFMDNTTWLHGFMAAYALWGGLVLLAVMLVGAWWSARRRTTGRPAVAAAVLTGIATLVAVGLNAQVLSPLIGRVRPCNALPHMTTLLPCNPDYSMPSDHAIIAGAFAAGFWLIDRRLGIIATLLSLLLAFSRVYVGVHYPSDVLVGLVAGALITLAIYALLRRRAVLVVDRLSQSRWYRLVAPVREAPHARPSVTNVRPSVT
ncbi:undecaprenyl-diphosphatase/undecaprenyl-diphosphatase [Antricoccus suffuscus]|uniref:Undecaprenyl-diphosphatase/undecaprenyl-diphosphatase n=1 Tax=Antricoccus suffuscus TaxID=1629062 RepID=A0A2T1A3D7_9ACTN|nr:phosphatase PAP2 family protein [Antricoccus suffuscus]PRZ43122.1 undecaprenyl-diphosphatase/undecaprenyl-diphosphatase [Antricoccus suffuscus]